MKIGIASFRCVVILFLSVLIIAASAENEGAIPRMEEFVASKEAAAAASTRTSSPKDTMIQSSEDKNFTLPPMSSSSSVPSTQHPSPSPSSSPPVVNPPSKSRFAKVFGILFLVVLSVAGMFMCIMHRNTVYFVFRECWYKFQRRWSILLGRDQYSVAGSETASLNEILFEEVGGSSNDGRVNPSYGGPSDLSAGLLGNH